MNLSITTTLKASPETDPNKAILQIYFNGEWIGQKLITTPDGLMDDRYPTVKKAIAIAEDSPLYTLSETIEAQVAEAIDSIAINLPDAYKRACKQRKDK